MKKTLEKQTEGKVQILVDISLPVKKKFASFFVLKPKMKWLRCYAMAIQKQNDKYLLITCWFGVDAISTQ